MKSLDRIVRRVANLLSVKSLVTLILTCVFAYLSVKMKVGQEFMIVYTVVIGFYFGTQNQKAQQLLDEKAEEEK